MKVVEIALAELHEASWNPNWADEAALSRLGASIGRFGSVLPLVVRPLGGGYEVLGGNQRLRLYRSQGLACVACVIVDLDEVQARLLAQALNALHGQDDINKKAALVGTLLQAMPESELLAILPDSADGLRGLATLGSLDADSMASALSIWDQARTVRLERISFAFSPAQRQVVEEAIARALPDSDGNDPNLRGQALSSICRDWIAAQ